MKKSALILFSLICVLLLGGMATAAAVPMVTIPPDKLSGLSEAALPTPVQVSPANNAALTHYPRQTTLAWQPVTGATGYQIERAYYGGSWVYYPVVTTTGNSNASYTFNFVGDQRGAWRVTALGTENSAPSSWWYFTYSTKPALSTPGNLQPVNNSHLVGYPRTTYLSWNPVPGATGYQVERAYYDGTWHAYAVVTREGLQNTSYSFNFVGDQEGRWRVTALGSASFANSAASSWRYFDWVSSSTRLATPVLVKPSSGTSLIGYPRTTTLVWNPVPGAVGYKIERAYYSSGTWYAYPEATVSGVMTRSYTFNFVGDQPGRWRVTAWGTYPFSNSTPSAWRTFTWSSASPLATPVAVSPVADIDFYHYPRTTTVTWNPVPGATGYKVERAFYSGSTWSPYSDVTTTGVSAAYYRWNFIGAQPGRWRVTATGASAPFADSAASTWREFTYHI